MSALQAAVEHSALKARILAEYPELVGDEMTLRDTLEGVSSLPDVLAALVRSIRDDEAVKGGRKAEIQALEASIEKIDQRIERKWRIIADAIEASGEKSVGLPMGKLVLGRSQAKVIVTDEAAIPDEFKSFPPPPEPKPDKVAIKKALEAGQQVPGVVLSNRETTVALRRA